MSTETTDLVFTTRGCFACGRDNPNGMRMELRPDGDGVSCPFTPRDDLRGFSKVVHGGIHATLLDEAIGVACGHAYGIRGATASLRVDYRRPLFVGQPVTVRARAIRRGKRFVYGRGEIVDAEGKVIASAWGRIVPLDAGGQVAFAGRVSRGAATVRLVAPL